MQRLSWWSWFVLIFTWLWAWGSGYHYGRAAAVRHINGISRDPRG